MPSQASNPEGQIPLRNRAESLLQQGTPPKAGIATAGWEALAAMHQLAADPVNGSFIVKFLHELQVHQVELDLQHVELEQGREELDQALNQYAERFDFAPVAYFAVDRDGIIIEGNLAGASLCGVEKDLLTGRRIDSLANTRSRFAILGMLKRLSLSGTRETCEAQIDGSNNVSRQFRVIATKLPTDHSFMVAFVETAPPDAPAVQV